jgi:hypothetical protein
MLGHLRPVERKAMLTQIGENRARKMLKANELVLCMGVNQLRTPNIAMIAAACGFDAVYIELVALAAALFLPTVGQIAERHPGLKLIVDHMAVPPGSSGGSAYRFQPELLALAKYPNVAVEATGQIGYTEDAYPFRSFHEHLHRCFDAFGADRMFWGTDITPDAVLLAAMRDGVNRGTALA